MYKDYNDFELLYLIGESNEEAINYIYDKYKPIVDMKVKKFIRYGKKVGLEYSDLFQEGMIGLSESIENFKSKKDVQFSTFANICIERQIYSALTKAGRKKHNILNDSLSLDNSVNDDNTILSDFIFDKTSDPSMFIESNESKKELYKQLSELLTPFEKEVFNLKISNFEYKEIAMLLNKSYKSIDSAIQRIRIKVKNILENIK